MEMFKPSTRCNGYPRGKIKLQNSTAERILKLWNGLTIKVTTLVKSHMCTIDRIKPDVKTQRHRDYLFKQTSE